MLSRLDIAFLPRSKSLLISWLHSPSAVILEPKKMKSVSVNVSPSIYHEVMAPDAMIFIFWMLSFKAGDAGEGNGNPLQYSCLENPTDGGAWEAAVHGWVTSLHFLLRAPNERDWSRRSLAYWLERVMGENWGVLGSLELWTPFKCVAGLKCRRS